MEIACTYNAAVLLAFSPKRIAECVEKDRAAFEKLVTCCVADRPYITHHPEFEKRFGPYLNFGEKIVYACHSRQSGGENVSLLQNLQKHCHSWKLAQWLYVQIVLDLEPLPDLHIVWQYLDAALKQKMVEKCLDAHPFNVILLPYCDQTEERIQAMVEVVEDLDAQKAGMPNKVFMADDYSLMDRYFCYSTNSLWLGNASAQTILACLRINLLKNKHREIAAQTFLQVVEGYPLMEWWAELHNGIRCHFDAVPEDIRSVRFCELCLQKGCDFTVVPEHLCTRQMRNYAFYLSNKYFSQLIAIEPGTDHDPIFVRRPTTSQVCMYLQRCRAHLTHPCPESSIFKLLKTYSNNVRVLSKMVEAGFEVFPLMCRSVLDKYAYYVRPADLSEEDRKVVYLAYLQHARYWDIVLLNDWSHYDGQALEKILDGLLASSAVKKFAHALGADTYRSGEWHLLLDQRHRTTHLAAKFRQHLCCKAYAKYKELRQQERKYSSCIDYDFMYDYNTRANDDVCEEVTN